MADTFKTQGNFAGHFMELDTNKDDDLSCDDSVVVEVVEVRDNGEVEIAFSFDHYRHYLEFRLKDFNRAVKEVKETE